MFSLLFWLENQSKMNSEFYKTEFVLKLTDQPDLSKKGTICFLKHLQSGEKFVTLQK